ncbi:hypothetical protein ACIQVO_36665 [Streptomyces sp. NPDC101062]|uniref:hypothetical protein n=1 Tax=unclassified Streptomyces TaxID=2593676 RepID=UPI00382470EF
MDFDPFTAGETADYAEDNAAYTSSLGALLAAAQRERDAQRGVPGDADPLVFPVEHDFVAHVTIPVDAVCDLAVRHTHPGALEEDITVGSDGLVVLGCGTRFIVVKGNGQLLSREEWEALTSKRKS